eukprot:4133314-Pyramimonas_sp.AAC.1
MTPPSRQRGFSRKSKKLRCAPCAARPIPQRSPVPGGLPGPCGTQGGMDPPGARRTGKGSI